MSLLDKAKQNKPSNKSEYRFIKIALTIDKFLSRLLTPAELIAVQSMRGSVSYGSNYIGLIRPTNKVITNAANIDIHYKKFSAFINKLIDLGVILEVKGREESGAIIHEYKLNPFVGFRGESISDAVKGFEGTMINNQFNK